MSKEISFKDMGLQIGQKIIVKAWWRKWKPTKCRITEIAEKYIVVWPQDNNPHHRLIDNFNDIKV